MPAIDVVFDTSVLDCALRSNRGASFRLIEQVGRTELFRTVVSVPLVLEYEEVLLRHRSEYGLTEADVEQVLDYIIASSRRIEIHFLIRPLLQDADDEMVVEAAIAGGCQAIITHNTRNFARARQLGIRILTPGEFIQEIQNR